MRRHGAKGIAHGMIATLAVSAALLSPRFTTPAYAHTGTVRFDNITTEQGLSHSTVTAILQDRQGFMWFGTEDGLNQYNGYQFTVYEHDPDNPKSLSDDMVYSICEGRSGELWVGTAAGLDRFDRATGTFAHYRHDPDDPYSLSGRPVLAILEDRTGTLWVGTEDGGLDRLDRVTNGFAHYQHAANDPQSLSDNAVYSIYQDHSGELWIGTLSGLDRLDQTTGLFTHYRLDPTESHMVGDYTVNAIYEDRQGALWIGTRGGLAQFDRSQNRFVEYRHDADDACSLSNDSIRSIYEDSRGTLWIGTRSGLDQLDRIQNCFIHYSHDPNDPYSLISDSIRAMYEDRSGILWIGTSGGGLSKYSQVAQRFTLYQYHPGLPNSLSDNNVWAIYEDHNGMLWVGTFFAGLNRLDRRSGTVAIYRHRPGEPASLSSDEVRVILEDGSGVLWVGTEHGGLNRFDPETETFFHYRHDASDPGSLSDDDVFALYQDRQGTLWIGTQQGGLNRLDRERGSFIHYQHDANDPFSLSDNHVEAIYEDHTGVLWVGTLGGIDLLDSVRNQFAHYRHEPQDPASLSNNMVTCIYESPDGTVWIGTLGGGLNRFDRATQTFTHYTEKDGLPDDTVYGILPGTEGHLWLSTNKGLSRFDPRRGDFRNYDVNDGLQSDQFNIRAYSKGRNGELFFGGVQGFNAFFPEQVRENLVPPLVVVTAFGKLNQTVQTNLAANEHIQLSYRDYLISFEFAALDYHAPAKNQYAYMLEGVDRDWVYAGTRRYASYTNLRGGDYVFQVKGSNSDGVWSPEGATLRISITPPFWETWWFIGIVGLVLVAGLIGGYRLRVKSIEVRSRELEKRVEERARELAALNAISAVVSRSLDLKEIMSNALDKTLNVTGLTMGVVYRLEGEPGDPPPGPLLRLVEHRGITQELARRIDPLPLHGNLVERAVAARQPIVWAAADDPQVALRHYMDEAGVKTGVSVPLLSKERIVGAIILGASDPRLFSPEALAPLYAIGQQIGVAVENARLYEAEQSRREEAERRRRVAEGLREILATLNSNRPLGEILDTIATQASHLLSSDATALYRLDKQTETLTIQASHGLSTEFAERLAFQVGPPSTTEKAILTRQPTMASNLVDQVAEADLPPEWRDMMERFTARFQSVLAVPLLLKSEIYGTLTLYYQSVRQFTEEEINLAVTFADQAALAIENARLREQAQQAAAMEERDRLARELHDSVTQSLYSVTLYAEAAAELLSSGETGTAAEHLRELRDTAQEALREMRLLIFELRPPALEKGGLTAALQMRLDAVETRGGVQSELHVDGSEALPRVVQVELYNIAREALNNALKHAFAHRVQVHLQFGDALTRLEVCDDGVGFELDIARLGGGFGISGMMERAQRIGGSLLIASAPGKGTKVTVQVPTHPTLPEKEGPATGGEEA